MGDGQGTHVDSAGSHAPAVLSSPVRRLRYLGVSLIVFTLASAQLGHMVAYGLKLGPGPAAAFQSQSVHSYFPTTARLAGALLGAGLILSLLIVGGARLLAGRRRRLQIETGWRWLDTMAVLFTMQLAIFAGQETIEALVAGASVTSVPELVLWGAIGQLPVAAVGGLALSWFSARLVQALRQLRAPVLESPQLWPAQPTCVSSWPPAALLPLRISAPAVFRKRGPPPNRLLHELP